MAGDWIKLEHATPEKPEMYRLARLLGVTRGDAFLLVVTWWTWLDQNTRHGNVTLMSQQDVDELMHTPGFAGAMKSVGWLEIDTEKDGCNTPNFDRHNGETAKNRALAAKRKQSERSRNGHDLIVTNSRPEKRREEVKPLRRDEPDGFVRFWSAWPATDRKVARAKCLEVWTRKRLDDDADAIVSHVTTMRDSKQWRDGYDPAPLTYLNQRRWEDGLPPPNAPQHARKVAM